jgi:diguanylate cyclase (GGDEF)-like protein/PAS domain S-box-containing protein
MQKNFFSTTLSSYRSALIVSFSYAILSSIWILYSDHILYSFVTDSALLTQMQTFKGWGFVAISAIFIYVLLYKKINSLKQVQRNYLEIFNTTTEAMFIHEQETGKIVDINQAAIKMFGYSSDEAIHLNISDFNLESAITETTESLQDNNTHSASFYRQVYKKNDDSIWAEISSQQFKAKDKALHITTVRDVTNRKQNEDVLRALAETATIADDDIFKTIVQQIASSLNIRYVLMGVIDPTDPLQINTIAIWDTDHFIENCHYSLVDTPCGNVTATGMCMYPDNVNQLFPKDTLLADMGAKSYIGVPLKNSEGAVLGILALLDDKAMHIKSHAIELLNSLAVRTSIELERKKSDEKLKLSSRVFTDTHEGIVITDPEGKIIDVNPTFCSVTGYNREEVIGKTPALLNSGKHSEEFYSVMWKNLNEIGHWQGEISNRKKDGELYVELLNISSLKNESGDIINYVGIFTDITESKEQQRQLEIMAHYDVLTQLPNRILFSDRFTQACAQSRRFDTTLAICFLDLDEFKPVNDQYGHMVGDRLLVEVAGRIKAYIREEDTVSRQGGDEFAILLVNLESPFHGEQMLDRIQHAIAQPFYIDGHTIAISASMGITLYPSDNADLDTLLRHADQAMYQAKLNGRNNYLFFNIEDDQKIVNRHLRLQEISDAIDNEQFCLYYQPKINLRTGEVFGVEALIRWLHPERGLISPINFLPIIEGHPLENKVGAWVIQQAIKQMNEWLSQGIDLHVSINIASQHFLTAEFCSELEVALANYPAVNAKHIQLEILESSVLGDLDSISMIIKECQNRFGISFALDDFGTGYSSLTHLRNLPINTVKIDQSFVKNMLEDPNDYAIIDGVIGLANSFDRELIAEGVETNEIGLMLLVMGCEFAQGFGIAHPMPAMHFSQWLSLYTPNTIWTECTAKNLSTKQKHVKLYRMAAQQWKDQFEKKILSDHGEDWPILDSSRCHCSSWIKRERQTKLIEKGLLDKLDDLHENMHEHVNKMYTIYQQGDHQHSRSKLSELNNIFEQIDHILDRCEQ